MEVNTSSVNLINLLTNKKEKYSCVEAIRIEDFTRTTNIFALMLREGSCKIFCRKTQRLIYEIPRNLFRNKYDFYRIKIINDYLISIYYNDKIQIFDFKKGEIFWEQEITDFYPTEFNQSEEKIYIQEARKMRAEDYNSIIIVDIKTKTSKTLFRNYYVDYFFCSNKIIGQFQSPKVDFSIFQDANTAKNCSNKKSKFCSLIFEDSCYDLFDEVLGKGNILFFFRRRFGMLNIEAFNLRTKKYIFKDSIEVVKIGPYNIKSFKIIGNQVFIFECEDWQNLYKNNYKVLSFNPKLSSKSTNSLPASSFIKPVNSFINNKAYKVAKQIQQLIINIFRKIIALFKKIANIAEFLRKRIFSHIKK